MPNLVTWLRYNTFYVLYPLGIASECALIWKASLVADRWEMLVLWGVMAAYVPGSWVLFRHMMSQRRKVLRGKGVEGRR